MKRILLLVLCTLFISQFGFAQEADSLKTDSTENIYRTKINSAEDYNRNYKLSLLEIEMGTLQAMLFIGDACSAWSDAIYNNEYKGRYVKDFHDALSLYRKDREYDKYWDEFVNSKEKIKPRIKSLNQYSPYFNKEAFEGLVKVSALYNEYYDYALSPSGSYNDYSEKTKELEKSIKRLLYELEVRYTY